jgi:hypothetical protein
MSTARSTDRKATDRGKTPNLLADLGDLVRSLARALFDTYRPELHYMRGPGPKWRAKNGRSHATLTFDAVPALAPARIKR